MQKENQSNECSKCGNEISPTDKFCGSCGNKINSKYDEIQNPDVNKKIEYETSTSVKKDGFAKVGLAFGILSIILWEFSIFPILAIVFSGLGISRTIKKQDAGLSMAIFGIVLGVIFLIVRISEL